VEGVGRTRALSSGIARVIERSRASGRLPQWHWQPDVLQQSCFKAAWSCAGWLCVGHALSDDWTLCSVAAFAMAGCSPTAS